MNLNPDTPEHPVTPGNSEENLAVTPLDMNRFQSRAFMVMSRTLDRLQSPGPRTVTSEGALITPGYAIKVSVQG